MKKLFKTFLTGMGLRAALLLAIVMLGFSITPVRAQGTYVAPRIVTLYSGFLTNYSYTNLCTLTNLLNYSGYHNINLLLSEWGITNGTGNPMLLGTNSVAVTVTGSPGNGNNYTNPASGSNLTFAQVPLLVWANSVSPGVTTVTATNNPAFAWTNMTQALGDSWQWFRFTVGVTATNTASGGTNSGFGLQLDAVLTP